MTKAADHKDFTTLTLQINGVAYTSPTVPVLLQIMSGASSAQSLLPAGSVYELPINSVIQLSLPAGVAGGPVRSFPLSLPNNSLMKPCSPTAPFPPPRARLRRHPQRGPDGCQLWEPAAPRRRQPRRRRGQRHHPLHYGQRELHHSRIVPRLALLSKAMCCRLVRGSSTATLTGILRRECCSPTCVDA